MNSCEEPLVHSVNWNGKLRGSWKKWTKHSEIIRFGLKNKPKQNPHEWLAFQLEI